MSSGNQLGTITVPAGASRNNLTTAVPFSIPFDALGLALSIPDAVTIHFYLTPGSSSTSASSTNLSQLGAELLQIVIPQGLTSEPVLALYNPGGAPVSVTVFQTDGKLQS